MSDWNNYYRGLTETEEKKGKQERVKKQESWVTTMNTVRANAIYDAKKIAWNAAKYKA